MSFSILGRMRVKSRNISCPFFHQFLGAVDMLTLCSNSRWMSPTSPFNSLIILRCPSTSTGDALRDLDKRDLITGDFVLVSGDVISNVNIDSAIAQHRARRGKDKNAIMTMVLRETGKTSRTKSSTRRPFFFIDPSQDRCLHYEEISSKDRGDKRFHLDDDLLARAEIDIRGDLLDCYIDICTPDVLGLWTDNFDYKSIRTSFLRGVLQDYELNGKTIHTHILQEGYVARVSSLRAYDAVTQDIIDRWSFPFTPDCNLLPGHNYRLQKNKVYTESGVVLARGSSVKSRSIMGKDTSVGDRTVISNSVLGRRCLIGKNVRIEGSYIWDDVVIGDDSVISGTVIANEVVVGAGCSIARGSLLSYRVQLGKGVQLPPRTRLTDDLISRNTSASSKKSVMGNGGAGHVYEPDSDASETSNYIIAAIPRNPSSDSLDSMSTIHSDAESEIGLIGDGLPSMSTSPTEDTRGSTIFLNEAITSIQDGILKGDDPDTVKLELLGQRLTHNASDTDMRDAIARALIKSVFIFIKPPPIDTENLLSTSPSANLFGSGSVILTALSSKDATIKVYETYSSVLRQLGIFDYKSSEKKDQIAVLGEIERQCASQGKTGQEVLLFALSELHRTLGVLQTEGVTQWWTGSEGDSGQVRKLASTYMDWVLESDDDDDDDEEEEETDDEEDEDSE